MYAMGDIQDARIIKSFRRSMSIQIGKDGIVLVKAPHGMPDFLIRRFIHSHQQWIEKHQTALAKKPKVPERKFAHGESFLYMGAEHKLHIGPHTSLSVKDGMILFPEFLTFRIQKELLSWYQRQAREIISTLVDEHALKMGVSYTELYFSVTTSKWGSCTHDNRLQFNWHLIMAPAIVIRYVVVHELVHTMIKNHSRAFWSKVEQYNPSYRQQRKWLRDHGHTIQEL